MYVHTYYIVSYPVTCRPGRCGRRQHPPRVSQGGHGGGGDAKDDRTDAEVEATFVVVVVVFVAVVAAAVWGELLAQPGGQEAAANQSLNL